jgi:hypothetical protein
MRNADDGDRVVFDEIEDYMRSLKIAAIAPCRPVRHPVRGGILG